MLRKILIVGAGKSTSYLIDYLLEKSEEEKLQVTIGDLTLKTIAPSVKNHPAVTLLKLDVVKQQARKNAITNADLVISMLPANLHGIVAKDCLFYGKHLITASYVSNEILSLDQEVKAKGLVFMNEIGLDPGIDHMCALQVLDKIRNKGGKIVLFESFTGGLIAPESDTNLWHYKFTWNPRNVVVAGQGGTAQFIQEGAYKYIPYHTLFSRTEPIDIKGYGSFEAYANRDSLKYRKAYGLEDAKTLYRGTIRKKGFSKAWNIFVQLGMTDDSFTIKNSQGMSYREFVNQFLAYSAADSVEMKFRHYLKSSQEDSIWKKFLELDIFSKSKTIKTKNATPAQILQEILEASWSLSKEDKDMVVMCHKFGYELAGKKHQLNAQLVVLGENHNHTAMAKTVGLPVAIAALLVLNKKITTPGVQIPIQKEVYRPILKELQAHGIVFKEEWISN